MHVIGIPTGSRKGGSPRIRFYAFLENLPAGYSWAEYNGNLDCDVLYIQKASTKDCISLVKKARKQGCAIVFDCDDGDGDRHKEDRYDLKMLSLADIVTTDTELRAAAFRKRTKTPVCVIPDCIDYGLGPDKAQFEGHQGPLRSVATFGTHKVLEACRAVLKRVPQEISRTYITDRKIEKMEKAGWKWRRWSLTDFPLCLADYDACVLCHPEDEIGSFKSNNRMLVAMALGIPTIVSNTPEYRRTAILAGVEDGIITSEIEAVVHRLSDPKIRNTMASAGHAYAWEEYAPIKSSLKLTEAFYAASVQAGARRERDYSRFEKRD